MIFGLFLAKMSIMHTISAVNFADKVVKNQKLTPKYSIRNELNMYLVMKKRWNDYETTYGLLSGKRSCCCRYEGSHRVWISIFSSSPYQNGPIF